VTDFVPATYLAVDVRSQYGSSAELKMRDQDDKVIG